MDSLEIIVIMKFDLKSADLGYVQTRCQKKVVVRTVFAVLGYLIARNGLLMATWTGCSAPLAGSNCWL